MKPRVSLQQIWVRRGLYFLVSCVGSVLWTRAEPIRVLLLSGQNNHDWKQTTPVLEGILERDRRFKVDVSEHPEACTAEDFSRYDVLLSNWNAWGPNAVTNWPEATRAGFLEFLRGGRGLVVVHAGSSSFYDWPEYQQAGAGSWDLSRTGHGSVHEFEVSIADPDHPITRGLKAFRTTDELWHRTGFQPGVQVLARAFSAEDRGGSGEDEPVAVTARFGAGRTFYLGLGHDTAAMASPGFQSLLVRGTEWAARGEVEQWQAAMVFRDDFRGRLGEGWSWVREDAAGWRVTEAGLEVRMQPGNMWGGSNDARNVLVRDAPEAAEQEVVVSMTLTNRPTVQYEQVDLVWYYDDSHMVKIGQELVDGQLSIVMGREENDRTRTIAIIPLDCFTVEVRHRVLGRRIVGEFRTPGSGEWKLAGTCDLPVQGKPKISLQFYQGPADTERWARITRLSVERGVR